VNVAPLPPPDVVVRDHPVLDVRDLAIVLDGRGGAVMPVTEVSLTIGHGGALALVGESGSGKTLTLRAILGLLPRGGRVARGEIRFGDGRDPPQQIDPARLRGRGLALVPQEPMTAMNPTMRLGDLVAAGARATRGLSRRQGRQLAADLLAEVGIPDPRSRLDAWPHELSGGMRQRAMIAMALATEPTLLLCDEPTTALDVTVQDQIVKLLQRIRADRGLAVLFVTHDLALAGQLCDQVAVIYAGRVVETGPIQDVYRRPAHRYSAALLAAVPDASRSDRPLAAIPGQTPDPAGYPGGCRFAPRCPAATEACASAVHQLTPIAPGRHTACIHPPS
jgi:oligopeptide/dipeptide ABC transporter ATP-binding protein